MDRAPALRELQRGLGALIGGSSTRGVFSKRWIESDAARGIDDRIAVYADAYFERLYEGLVADFPATALAVDTRWGKRGGFRKVVAGYLESCPPRGAGISDVGAALADFIAKAGGRGGAGCAWIAELARLEWAVLESFYSAEGRVVSASELSEIGENSLPFACFEFAPSLRLLETRYPVEKLWRLRREPRAFRKSVREMRACRVPATLCLWRDPRHGEMFGGVSVVQLESGAAALLGALRRGRDLAGACQWLERQARKNAAISASPALIQRWFADWIAGGVIMRVLAPACVRSRC